MSSNVHHSHMEISHVMEFDGPTDPRGIHLRPLTELNIFSIKLKEKHPMIHAYITTKGPTEKRMDEMDEREIMYMSVNNFLSLYDFSSKYHRDKCTRFQYMLRGPEERVKGIADAVKNAIKQMVEDWNNDHYPYYSDTKEVP